MFRLTVADFFREFYKLTLNAYIYKPELVAMRGPMIIKASPNIRTGTGEVIFFSKVRKYLGATAFAKNRGLEIFFSVRI